MAITCLQIFSTMEEDLRDLPDTAIGELMRACMDFQFHDRVWEKEEFATEAVYKWTLFKKWLTAAAVAYAAKVANGKKGGRPRKKAELPKQELRGALSDPQFLSMQPVSTALSTEGSPAEAAASPSEIPSESSRTETEAKPDHNLTETENNQVTSIKYQVTSTM